MFQNVTATELLRSLHTKMDKEDIENLEFLLSLDDEEWKAWTEQASVVDITYVYRLLALYTSYIEIKDIEANDNIVDVTEANYILKRYMLR